MLTIRLQRAGKKNKAEFRVVLAEKTAASQKKFVEVLGTYNPHTKALGIRNQERLNYWIDEQHVEVSPTVHNLLVTKELVKGSKAKAFTIPKKEVVAEEAPAEAPAAEETPAAEDAPVSSPEAAESAPEVVASEEVASEAPAAEAVPAPETTEETPSEAPAEEPQA